MSNDGSDGDDLLFTRLGGPKALDIRQIISALPDIVTIRQAAYLGRKMPVRKIGK